MALTVTAGAAKFMQRMIRLGGAGEQAGLRLVVTPGGCSGLNSDFTVEAAPLLDDPGETVVCSRARERLAGPLGDIPVNNAAMSVTENG